ncbi:MAG: CsiV family protein [Gammaproteobacteria bacterium]
MKRPSIKQRTHDNPTRKLGISLCALLLSGLSIHGAQAQERWFKIEVSIFTNELAADRNEERWTPEQLELQYPNRLRRLDSLLSQFFTPALLPETGNADADFSGIDTTEVEFTAQQQLREFISLTGPFPPESGDTYRVPDLERDAFIRLPDSESDFQQSNRAIDRSPEHRLLYHAVWRQPVRQAGASSHIFITAGQQFSGRSELEGSLGIYFNRNEDRVVVDANLWLSEFTSLPLADEESAWMLPSRPTSLTPLPYENVTSLEATDNAVAYRPSRIFHMQQTREMRSTEFHYLDHPALGIVITVEPYEVPDLPEPAPELPEESLPLLPD